MIFSAWPFLPHQEHLFNSVIMQTFICLSICLETKKFFTKKNIQSSKFELNKGKNKEKHYYF